VGKGATIVFEDLTNIRGRAKARKAQRRRLHGWSFAQFQTFVAYKAEARSIRIGFVDPRYTSQKCSQCQHNTRGNRPTQAEFRCKKCGFELSADHNAAINIREDYLKLRGAARCCRGKLPPANSLVNHPIAVCPEMEVGIASHGACPRGS
jgi:IS605 OrfB family transposase